jgi:hypothetical protein
MKRLLVFFLLFALPLQVSWAVSATYCQHEGGKTAQHFGHHTHQHQATADGNDDAGTSPLKLHADCSICHLSCPAAVALVDPVVVIGPAGVEVADYHDVVPSTILERPERPNWMPAA